ncbi:MAG: HAD-IC family P-type ATPase [Candidatus Caccovivens sp.]
MKRIKKSKKKKQILQDIPIVRYQTDKEHGLSEEQINERIEHKLVNDTKIKTSNSYLAIICKNVFTIFNCIWLFIAVALMCVNAWSDLLFLFVVIANTAISIFQEIKAKNTVEKLSMVTAPKIKVIRMGLQLEVKGEDLLLDDIIVLENGNQIPADCIIVEGNVEANESLLTGESNLIKKQEGDILLAGSFLVAGLCYARVDKVGKNNYIQTVAERTKDFKPQTSNLFKDLNNLIKIIIVILIPVGVLTFCKEYLMAGSTVQESVTSTSGALTGMIPAGMYLLITVGLSVGVIKLARKKTLVKNLYSIEMLARANVLCLDKTGTITDGTMNVVEVVPQDNVKIENIQKVMKVILANQKTMNATSVALLEHFGKETGNVKEVIEFSSQRKYSATTLANGKTYFIGAVGFIKCAITSAQKKLMESYMEKGYRVISFVEDANPYNEKMAGKRGKLLAFFVLEDHIRKDAVETIDWFKKNNVDIKIISGDDALTVSKIAKRVGVDNYDKYISLENMSLQEVAQIAGKFTVFGRVTPEQKHTIIKTLKTQGHVVAMTGDGVNDTLALKEANCSIAMADGSEVARNISHLVLMESNFSALPAIVKEGRQIVNNVQSSSVLYLMKTLFTIMLCITTLVLKISYPFTPKQLLLLEMFVIGVPSFILTFQPNSDIIRGNFIPQVLKKSIPCSIVMFVNILIVLILNENTTTLMPSEYTSLCTLLLTFIGYINLVWICWPLNWLRSICVAISAILIISTLSGLGKFFSITDYTFPVMITLVTLLLCSIMILVGIFYLKEWWQHKKMSNVGTVPVKTENSNKRDSWWQKISSKFTKEKDDENLTVTFETPEKSNTTTPKKSNTTKKVESAESQPNNETKPQQNKVVKSKKQNESSLEKTTKSNNTKSKRNTKN